MNRVERTVLRNYYNTLVNQLVPFAASNILFEKHIISKLERDNIQSEAVKYKANCLLLKALERSVDKRAFSVLVDIIEDVNPESAERLRGA